MSPREKKTFKDAIKDDKAQAVAAFMSQAEQVREKKKERNTARVNLTLPPSLKDDLSLLSRITGKHINALICDMIRDHVDKNRQQLDECKALFAKLENEDKTV